MEEVVKEVEIEELENEEVDASAVEAPTSTVAAVATVDTSKLDAAIAVDEMKLEIKKLKRELKVNPGNQEAATKLATLESELKTVNSKKWKKRIAIGGAIVGTVTGAVAIGVSLTKKKSGDDPVTDTTFEEVKSEE